MTFDKNLGRQAGQLFTYLMFGFGMLAIIGGAHPVAGLYLMVSLLAWILWRLCDDDAAR